jgi:exodeoxyribonuclease V alpha subunit
MMPMDAQKTLKENITGTLEKIIFRNGDNDFLIATLKDEQTNEMVTFFGVLPNVNIGEHLELKGQWVSNPKYGRQFKIITARVLVPSTAKGIERYLGSGLIKGIGPVMAKKIVSRFKTETLNIIDKEPERLMELDGLGKKRIELIKKEWKSQNEVRDVMIFLQSHGISPIYSKKIYNTYGSDSVAVIRSNPYKLTTDIMGIGFRTADRIARETGIDKDSLFRIKAGILYLLGCLEEMGNCYYPYEQFMEQAITFLDIGSKALKEGVSDLLEEGKIFVEEEEKIYLKELYEDECFVSQRLSELVDHDDKLGPLHEKIQKHIDEVIGSLSMEVDEDQKEAIKSALTEKILVITGSPGTGKSTILDIILKLFNRYSQKVLLAAPTGRASKRLTETTNTEARTIHRLLEYNPKTNNFAKNSTSKLNCDVLIIDESSMIDIRLMKNLLEALDDRTRVIFVGDVAQLPSVGPGNVLKDMIACGRFKVVVLRKIYRQEGKSLIIMNAHRIRDGVFPELKNQEDRDFYFIENNEPQKVVDIILELLSKRVPDRYGFDPLKDIQVLVPTNKGVVGVKNLNLCIQEKVNSCKLKIFKGAIEYRLKDKVIQLKNNYEKDIYNGDIGIIEEIDREMQEITVMFSGRLVKYNFYELDEIAHSYAISIHKSQGSEFKCVIVPILTSHYMLLQRNLLYTAITRAREVAILIGSKKAIGIAINRNNIEERYTSLDTLLK